MSIFNPTQPLLFDPNKEKIKRQTSSITPMRVVYPETQKHKVSSDIESGRKKAFESDGVLGLIETEEDAEYVARIMARLKYGSTHLLFNDLASGLYSALTRKEGFAEEPRQLVDKESQRPIKTVFTLSHEALYKLMLGPIVNDNGRAIMGAGPVVDQLKREITPILRGEESEPIACSSIHRRNSEGRLIEAAIFGKPIIIDKWSKNAVRILLDHYFFPIFESEIKADDKYLNQVAGLSAFLGFGRYILKQKGIKGSFPQTPDAHKLILSIQAACEMDGFAPGIVRQNSLGRNNVVLRRIAIRSLRPEAINSKGYPNFKEFSEFVSHVGQMYWEALEETGIKDQLPDNVMIPATSKGAEFPSDPRIVFIKVDRKK